ncbi:anthranilate synthase component II [Glaciecola petra]|uniref:Aminodeoxychorismate/anthranilate synthase component II n=1 Tax=Glaciecola petra TaxID=3075602 RepID=A0ABU2ZSE8_9ALTE|nr:aminodeoxychorismate/anthranilate synthase component II [Aestuariibacter sp. P117]MDT0595558.1 aminodeoxychorismate/anthranilate synthase component II [Aestuariibacter sp. P117]
MIVIIDNYDSFTYNLERYFVELGHQTRVIKNDELNIAQLSKIKCSHLVISPGPCTPNESGICIEAINTFAGSVPILGVCLGHQAIAQVFGGKVVRARHVRHGKTSVLNVTSNTSQLFKGCPSTFIVTRYHSLIVDDSELDKAFLVTATCNTENNREVMAIENQQCRIYGLQYHPESLLTEHGHKVLKNFLLQG